MLRAINTVPCTPALNACRQLQVQLFEWLCDPVVGPQDLTQANLRVRFNTQIEADWLWGLLQKADKSVTLLTHAQTLAGSPRAKAPLRAWVHAVSNVPAQFEANPPVWPAGLPNLVLTAAEKTAVGSLALCFYTKGLKATQGLPYASNGVPTTMAGVTYSRFVQEFRDAHRASLVRHAREVCVLCGGPLGSPEVDHWILESAFPILSVCGLNLLPACGECNSPAYKGQKPVFAENTPSAFADWFHPYCRPANGAFQLSYVAHNAEVVVSAVNVIDVNKVNNLNELLCLESRWTREFKAQYETVWGQVKKLVRVHRLTATSAAIAGYIQTQQAALLQTEPHFHVHQLVLTAVLEPARLAAWEAELRMP